MNHRRQAGMIDAWHVLASAINDVRDIGVYLVGLNILWFFTNCLIITAPPATMALYAMTRELGYRRSVTWQDYFGFMRQYAGVSYKWVLINAVVVSITGVNIAFYQSFPPTIEFLASGIWLVIFTLWLTIQMYCLPLLMEQEEPSIRTASRNALVLVLRHPRFTMTFAIVTLVFIILSIAVAYFWIFFTISLLCYFYNRGVWYLVLIERGEEPVLK